MSLENKNYFTRIEELRTLFIAYNNDKKSIPNEWQEFFGDLTSEASKFLEEQCLDDFKSFKVPISNLNGVNVDSLNTKSATLDSIRALMLIRAYRVRGHLKANLDPYWCLNHFQIHENTLLLLNKSYHFSLILQISLLANILQN